MLSQVVLTMYIGVLFTTASIANLTHLMTDLDKDLDAFQQKQENLNKYMAYRNLPHSLRDRIRNYFFYMWSILKGVDEQQFVNELPPSLKTQVTALRTKDLIRRIPFLRDLQSHVLEELSLFMEPIIFSPGVRTPLRHT